MASYGVAPITLVLGGQEAILLVTDGSSNELPVYLDQDLRTRVTQPFRIEGRPSLTLFRPLGAASESATVTLLVQGEPTKNAVTLAPAGVTITLASAPGSALGNVTGGGGALNDRGNWSGPGTVYAVGDVVSNSGTRYECNTAHTSSASFSTDAAKWTQLGIDSANAVLLSTSAADIQPTNTTGAVAGSTGRGADAGHGHPVGAHDHTTTAKGGQIPPSALQSSAGTADSSHFYRGDGVWATAGGGAAAAYGYDSGSGVFLVRPLGTAVSNSTALSNGFMRGVPFVIPEPRTIVAVAISVATAAAGETVRFGLYDDTGTAGLPGSRLYEFPSTADCSTTGVKEITGSYALTAGGRIWVVGCTQGGVATAVFSASSGPIEMGTCSGDNSGFFSQITSGAYNTAGGVTGALPSTFGAASETTANLLFRFFLKLS